MRAPLRIRKRDAAAGTRPGEAPAPGPAPDGLDPLRGWLERLVKLVPAEIVMLYLAGRSHAGAIPDLWPVICLVLLVIVRVWGTREPPKGPQWIAVGISAVSFVVWVFAIGGRFAGLALDPDTSALVGLMWVTVVPVVYRGD